MYLIPEWKTMEQLCGGYDFKEATYWDMLNAALTDLEDNFPPYLFLNDALNMANNIQFANSYAATTTIGRYIIPGSYSDMKFDLEYVYTYGFERAAYIKSKLTTALSSNPFLQTNFLLQKQHSAATGKVFSPKRSFYSNFKWFTRGGKRGRYTQPFYIVACVKVCFFFFGLRKKGSMRRARKKTKEDEIEKGNYTTSNRNVCDILSDWN